MPRDHFDINEPDNTCPDIDNAIDAVEALAARLNALRRQNEQLRDWGQDWEKAARLERDRADKAEDRADDLESKVEQLEVRINELENGPGFVR